MVYSLTHFFAVLKGEDDIWMVYNGTKISLNGALWALLFGLLSVELIFNGLESNSVMGGNDLREMFLNF